MAESDEYADTVALLIPMQGVDSGLLDPKPRARTLCMSRADCNSPTTYTITIMVLHTEASYLHFRCKDR